MGVPHLFEEPVLFIGSLFSEQKIFDEILPVLKASSGNVLFQSPVRLWSFSDHYNRELGIPIFRAFVFFDRIIDPSTLADIKLFTNELEEKYSLGGKRRINLDPGYLTLAKVVLASTKNYSHRIYMGKGIYAELTLIYRGGRFVVMPFAYNDYKDPVYVDMFTKVRTLLKKQEKMPEKA